MGTKTYTSSSMSNLNSSNPEYRWERLSILEGAMANWQHIYQGQHLSDTHLGGQGTGFRNWIYWARNYQFKNYNDPDIGADEQVFNEMIKFYEPSVSATPALSSDQEQGFLEDHFNYDSTPEELGTYTLKCAGIMPDNSYKEVSITGSTRKVKKYKVINVYSGNYNIAELGAAYIWKEWKQYLKDNEYIKRFIYTDTTEKSYQIVNGNGLSEAGEEDDTQVDQSGNVDDIWVMFGYVIIEPHTDEDTGENVNLEVFNSEQNVYIPLKVEITSLIPEYNNTTLFYVLYGYFYNIYEIDASKYTLNGGCIELDSSGRPIMKEPETPPDGEYIPNYQPVKLYYEFEYEDWEKTVKETYASYADAESFEGFGYIEKATTAAQDPNLGSSVDLNLKDISSKMPPIICFRHDKSWLSTDPKDYWFLRNTKACKKVQKDDTYYSTLHGELKEQITQGDVAWVYLMYGLPCNYAQTHYGCHYALQFFKQLTVPNWNQYKKGDVANVTCRGRSYTYGSHQFNLHYSFSIGSTNYQCGKGICPAPGFSDIRRGEVGICNYGGGTTFWRQWDTDSWEMIIVHGYSASFINIKNGVGSSPGGADWYLPIWRQENVERQYSKCLLPLMWEVGQNIPYPDWTDMIQFCANIGATAYKVVKTKWYQTGLFKIILIIVIIVISIIISITSGGVMSGPAAELGASIAAAIGGSTAFWSAVISTAITVAAAVAVNAIITPFLKDVFGEVLGSILGAALAIAVAYSINSNSFNISDLIDEFMSPSSWVSVANAAINGYIEMLQNKIEDLYNDYQNFMNRAQEKQDEINQAYADTLGSKTANAVYKQWVYGAATGNALDNVVVETGDQFCARTITNCVNAISNAIYTLENYPQLVIDNQTNGAIMFGTGSSSNSLGQIV